MLFNEKFPLHDNVRCNHISTCYNSNPVCLHPESELPQYPLVKNTNTIAHGALYYLACPLVQCVTAVNPPIDSLGKALGGNPI